MIDPVPTTESVPDPAPAEPPAVLVARDVLERLDALELRCGTYLRSRGDRFPAGPGKPFDDEGYLLWGPDSKPVVPDVDAREVLPDLEAGCVVCLLGACLLSKIRVFDRVRLADLVCRHSGRVQTNSERTYALLEDAFDRETLGLLESCFEGEARFAKDAGCADDLAYGAVLFGLKAGRTDLKARCRAAMKNVIAFGGKFRPVPAAEEYVWGYQAGLAAALEERGR